MTTITNGIQFLDENGNPITGLASSVGLPLNIKSIGGFATVMGTSGPTIAGQIPEFMPVWSDGGTGANSPRGFVGDAAGPANILEVGIGGFNGSNVDRQRFPVVFKPFNAQAVTASSANTPTSIWTPAAGKKFRLMGYWFSSSAAAGLVFHDLAVQGGGGLIPLPSPLAAAAGIVQSPANLANGFLSAAANNQLWIDATAATTLTGFVWGTEE